MIKRSHEIVLTGPVNTKTETRMRRIHIKTGICWALLLLVMTTGCRLPWGRNQGHDNGGGYFDRSWKGSSDKIPFASRTPVDASHLKHYLPPENSSPESQSSASSSNATHAVAWNGSQGTPANTSTVMPEAKAPATQPIVVRGQDPGVRTANWAQDGEFANDVTFQAPNHQANRIPSSMSSVDNSVQSNGTVKQMTYQYPELNSTTPANPLMIPSPQLGAPNEMYPGIMSNAPSGVGTFPQNYADLQIDVSEARTGRVNIGGAYNSDNGLVGQFVIDEQNFDIRRFPRSIRDITDGIAWRGAGQSFRLELVPGTEVQRYMVNFVEPYFLDTPVSLSLSGFLFDRRYFDWSEQRLGGRVALGYRLTPDLSLSAALRMEDVDIYNPRVNTSAQLNNALGSTDLFLGQVSLVNDTRDHPFLPTEGIFMSLAFSQAFGEASFPRGDVELRNYKLMYQRPDGSGRHTVSHGVRLGFSGSDTPIFENYFAGGFSTMRGFSFRGVGPTETGVRVGGQFQMLNTLEYTFPLTADDMIKGVLFCDYGTIEEDVRIDWDNFRVAPGFGFRVHMPAAGLGAPLAFDFAFPVNRADGDDLQMFSFYMGFNR